MTSPSGGDQYQQGAGAPGTPHGPKITSIFDFSAEALEALAFWLEQRGLHIPIAQVLGFSQFTVNVNTQTGVGTTTSTTYTDLSDGAHPSITGLPDGKYELRFGALSTGTGAHKMGLQINGSAPTADLEISTLNGGHWVAAVTLANGGNNTITAKYKGNDGSLVQWSNRYLSVLRYANT